MSTSTKRFQSLARRVGWTTLFLSLVACSPAKQEKPKPPVNRQPTQTNESNSSEPLTFKVGGTINAISGTVVLQNNSGNNLSISTNGTFSFGSMLVNGANYNVSILTQPASQTCNLTNPSGTIAGANISNVTVTCSPNSYSIGGRVNSLAGTVVLRNNGGNDLSVSSIGAFVFSNPLINGASYRVSVYTQPLGQTCTIASEEGRVSGAPITSVNVNCSYNSYTVGGRVTGLSGTIVLQNNGGDNKTLTVDSSFSFATLLLHGSSYNVTVASQPSTQICTPEHASGTVNGANVTEVVISCRSKPDFTLSGNWMFDSVSPVVGIGLDYSHLSRKPIRRALVWAMNGDTRVAETQTDDNGHFSLLVPGGSEVTLAALAVAKATNYHPDGVGPDNCNGASWDIRVVDNTHGGAPYVLQTNSSRPWTESDSHVSLFAPLIYTPGDYVDRAAAPFAILDTAISEIELVCQGRRDINFPLVFLNWSPNNVPLLGEHGSDPVSGDIGTTFFTILDDGSNQIFILGSENVDTDEYDNHVIAHEFGHYIENALFRSDSIGGTHSLRDSLDPRVAFGEGFGNAISGMVFNDPVYQDTFGVRQSEDFAFSVEVLPTTRDDRGVYSETSVQHLLWSLYENRDSFFHHGSFDRIYNVMANFQSTTPAFTTAQSFAAYYNQVYGGNSEDLRNLWSVRLGTPYNSLCAGVCQGTNDIADPFDLGGDIGVEYGSTSLSARRYPQGLPGRTFPSDFWNLYRTLTVGANALSAHDQTNFGGYFDPFNKFGAVRWYRYVSTSNNSISVSVSGLVGDACSDDVLDMYVYDSGTLIRLNENLSGCPSLTFNAQNGRVYVIELEGLTREVSSWVMTVNQ